MGCCYGWLSDVAFAEEAVMIIATTMLWRVFRSAPISADLTNMFFGGANFHRYGD